MKPESLIPLLRGSPPHRTTVIQFTSDHRCPGIARITPCGLPRRMPFRSRVAFPDPDGLCGSVPEGFPADRRRSVDLSSHGTSHDCYVTRSGSSRNYYGEHLCIQSVKDRKVSGESLFGFRTIVLVISASSAFVARIAVVHTASRTGIRGIKGDLAFVAHHRSPLRRFPGGRGPILPGPHGPVSSLYPYTARPHKKTIDAKP